MADGDLAAVPHQRRAQQTWLGQRALEQALRRVERHAQAHVSVGRAVLVDHGRRPEAIGESLELAFGRGALLQIDEVHGNPALGEEAQRFARVLAIMEPEDLNVYDECAFCAAALSSSHTLIGTGGWPSGFARPLRSPWQSEPPVATSPCARQR